MNKKLYYIISICTFVSVAYISYQTFFSEKKPVVEVSAYQDSDRQGCIDMFYEDFYWLTDGYDRETYDFGKQLDTRKSINVDREDDLEFFVARINGKVVGFSTITEEKDADSNQSVGRLLFLSVKKDSRRFGVGSKLMKKSLDELQGRGHKIAFLTARSCNGRAVSLYKKFGFENITDFDTEESNSTVFIKRF